MIINALLFLQAIPYQLTLVQHKTDSLSQIELQYISSFNEHILFYNYLQKYVLLCF